MGVAIAIDPFQVVYPKTDVFFWYEPFTTTAPLQGQLFGNHYPDEIAGQGATRSRVSLFGYLSQFIASAFA